MTRKKHVICFILIAIYILVKINFIFSTPEIVTRGWSEVAAKEGAGVATLEEHIERTVHVVRGRIISEDVGRVRRGFTLTSLTFAI